MCILIREQVLHTTFVGQNHIKQNQAMVTSQCIHNIFCRGREVKHSDESVLTCDEKRGEGKGEMNHRPLDEKWTCKPLSLDKK